MNEKIEEIDKQVLTEIPSHYPRNWKLIGIIFGLFIISAAGGVFSGWWFWKNKFVATSAGLSSYPSSSEISLLQQDNQTFRDSAEGILEKNEISSQYSQGTHKLVREGGSNQAVYLVSSVIDLDQYVGKRVKVWGETFQSTQVGWFMDVGKVEKLE